MVGWFEGVSSLWLIGLEGLSVMVGLFWRGWFVMVGWLVFFILDWLKWS